MEEQKITKDIIIQSREKWIKTEYIKTLTEDQRKWLKDFVAKSEIDTCMSCPCFSWDYDENKKMSGYICTLGGEPSLAKKGKCV